MTPRFLRRVQEAVARLQDRDYLPTTSMSTVISSSNRTCGMVEVSLAVSSYKGQLSGRVPAVRMASYLVRAQ